SSSGSPLPVVVRSMVRSCMRKGTPSFETFTSISMISTPRRMASWIAFSEFSGKRLWVARCDATSTVPDVASRKVCRISSALRCASETKFKTRKKNTKNERLITSYQLVNKYFVVVGHVHAGAFGVLAAVRVFIFQIEIKGTVAGYRERLH